SPVACRLSPVACRLSPVACRRSPVAGRRSQFAVRYDISPHLMLTYVKLSNATSWSNATSQSAVLTALLLGDSLRYALFKFLTFSQNILLIFPL
ncbi:hypothetical protein, partial [Megasphaera sp.]|uniref:hypothetical protein n=1 Tax=Megasphaera sp. TaxID=2023260 RepID=UPI004024D000